MDSELQPLSDPASDPLEYTRKAIIILGMHRSGTSALSNLFVTLGGDGPATLMPPTQDNPKGYFESVPLYLLHDELLASAGSSWDDYTPIPESWTLSPKADEFRLKLEESLQSEYGRSGFFIVKDPRICRIVPLWRRALAQMQVSPLFVHTHRNPIEVATSLHKRDGFDVEYGCLAWLRHILDAEFGSRGQVRSFTSYDRIMEDWLAEATKIAADLKISWPKYSVFNASELNAVIEPDLKRNVMGLGHLRGNRMISGWITQVHDIFTRWATSGEVADDRQSLDAIRGAFDESVALFHGVVHRRGKGLIEERDEASRRAEEAAAHVTGQQALIDTLVAERDEAGALAHTRGADLAEQQALVQALTAERDAQIEQSHLDQSRLAQQKAELDDLWRDLDVSRNALAEAEKAQLDLAGQVARFSAELEQLHAEKSSYAQELAASRSILEAHQDEIAALRAQGDDDRRALADTQAQNAVEQQRVAALTAERDESLGRIEELRVSSAIAAAQQTVLLSQLQIRLTENEDRRRAMQIEMDRMNDRIRSSAEYRIKKLYKRIFG
jgi:hypothetical protein